VQQWLAAPHAVHGHVVHEGDTKNRVHAPATQTSLLAHTLLQPPQFTGSDASCAFVRHAPLQNVRPIAPHVPTFWHEPSTQRWPPPKLHVVPQVPQLNASCRTLAHMPPHDVRPGRHVHADETHACVFMHAVPHAPQ
jgi:hypothetical protein